MIVLEIFGIWLFVTAVLAFICGRTGILFDDDWGIFIAIGIAVWPLILLAIAILAAAIIPMMLFYFFVMSIGKLGTKKEN